MNLVFVRCISRLVHSYARIEWVHRLVWALLEAGQCLSSFGWNATKGRLVPVGESTIVPRFLVGFLLFCYVDSPRSVVFLNPSRFQVDCWLKMDARFANGYRRQNCHESRVWLLENCLACSDN